MTHNIDAINKLGELNETKNTYELYGNILTNATSTLSKLTKKYINMGILLKKLYELNKQYNYNYYFTNILHKIKEALEPLPRVMYDTKNVDKKYKNNDLFSSIMFNIVISKFEYTNELNTLLNLETNKDKYIPLIKTMNDPNITHLLNIYKSSQIGIEIESCFSVTSDVDIDIIKKIKTKKHNQLSTFIKYFDNLSNEYMPKNDNHPDNSTFTDDVVGYGGDNTREKYSTWRLHVDPTIRCDKKDTYAIEIASPILYLNDGNNSNNKKNEIWKIIAKKFYNENFGTRYEYSEGMFYFTCVYNFIINNHVDKYYVPNVKITTHNNDSQGLHLHVSNPYMDLQVINNYDKTVSYSGLGAIKMIYFVRTFAYFEYVIRSFIKRDMNLSKVVWARGIYYDREKISKGLRDRSIGEKKYIDIKLSNKIFAYIKDIDTNLTYIGEMFSQIRDIILPKCGIYHGAFSLNIYNDKHKCHMSNKLKNKNCKGHIEIRVYHSTDDFAEIHNWILFINLLLSKCISIIDQLFTNKYSEEYKTLFDKFVKPFPVDFSDSKVCDEMLNELFDEYIQNNALKEFYFERSSIKNMSEIVTNNLDLHSDKIFYPSGKLLSDSILTSIMKIVPLDDSELNKSKFIENINKLDNYNDNRLLKN